MPNLIFYDTIYLISNFMLIYAKYKAMRIFFSESKITKKLEVFLYIGYFIINSVLYLIFKNPNINLANNIILLFLLTFIYISPIPKKVIATIIIIAVSVSNEIIIYHLFQLFRLEINDMEVIVMLVSSMSFYFVVFLAKNLNYIKANYKISFNHIVMISSISISTIYIIIVLINNTMKNNEIHIIFCIAFLFIVNIFIPYMYDILNKTHEKDLEKKLLEQQNDFYIKQLKIMKEAQDNIKYLKHDINNHLLSIKAISNESNDIKTIDKYINNILSLTDVSDEYAQSGNIFIDSLLNYKLQEAQKKHIDIELELKIPNQLNIEPYDMGIILGNLLDNAITAVSKNTEDKKIKIVIYFEKNNLYINIVNTFDGKININEDKYETTKPNQIDHGFGLSSVEKALKKYNGEINISYTESLFSVKILMYNTPNQ